MHPGIDTLVLLLSLLLHHALLTGIVLDVHTQSIQIYIDTYMIRKTLTVWATIMWSDVTGRQVTT